MPYEHRDKSAGDLIRSADWNAMSLEVQRLASDKVDRAGDDTVAGPLAVRGELTVGTAQAGSAVRVLRRQEDASGADHGALVVGTGSPTAATLRVGYGSGFSWLQGSGQQALALNPRGGNVGVGTGTPQARLHVAGGDLRLDAGREIVFADGGQLRSLDNAHRILFRRSENKLELREFGDIVFSPGATAGNETAKAVLTAGGQLGIGVANPTQPLEVAGDVVVGGPPGQRFLLHTRRNGSGDFLQLTVDAANGAWDWAKGITLRRDTGNVGIGTANPRSPLDTGRGVMSGAANDYLKAQFTLSGGGHVTWNDGRLGWTQRFIAISANRGNAHGSGHVDIVQPSGSIPAEFVFDGTARAVTAAGVPLGAWEALYAVHEVGGSNASVTFRIVRYTHGFDAPSNWILVAVVNGDVNQVKLGTGQIIGFVHTVHAGDLRFGHPSRSGSARPGSFGRALVDETSVLSLNYAADWPGGVRVYGRLQTASGREIRTAANSVQVTTNGWVDLAGMQLSIATTGNPLLLLFKTGGVQMTGVASGRARFRLLVGGAVVATAVHEFHNQGWELRDVVLTSLATPAAGTHDVRVQWGLYDTGGTLTCCWYGDNRTLIAVEL